LFEFENIIKLNLAVKFLVTVMSTLTLKIANEQKGTQIVYLFYFQCLHNTEGANCQICKNGFFGNPIASIEEQGWKDCRCDEDGTIPGTNCNAETGTCQCRKGK
jgi:hypothetical protein